MDRLARWRPVSGTGVWPGRAGGVAPASGAVHVPVDRPVAADRRGAGAGRSGGSRPLCPGSPRPISAAAGR